MKIKPVLTYFLFNSDGLKLFCNTLCIGLDLKLILTVCQPKKYVYNKNKKISPAPGSSEPFLGFFPALASFKLNLNISTNLIIDFFVVPLVILLQSYPRSMPM